MKVVFISCYFNHHQKPFSDAMVAKGVDYTFLETMPMPEDRRELGYHTISRPEYVRSWLKYPADCEMLIDAADVILFSSAPERLLRRCFGQGKLLYRVTERPLKRAGEWQRFLPRLVKWRWRNPPREKISLLSASAFAPADYAKFGLFQNAAYRWGYFPAYKQDVNSNALLRSKKRHSLLWAGRFLDWKHPDDALRAAAQLRENGYDFSLEMIGAGPKWSELHAMRDRMGLSNCVSFPGAMPTDELRQKMEEAEIFLFTSDRYEGWGAVLNEAMSSVCAVAASHAAGATPYLINPYKNGLVYPAGNSLALASCVKQLLEDEGKRQCLASAARDTIVSEWNAGTAAERFLVLTEHLQSKKQNDTLFTSGPCSKAEIIKEDWFHEKENA